MAGITLEVAKTHLDGWLEAEMNVMVNQSYKIGTRELTKANLAEIRESVKYWSQKVSELENVRKYGGRNRVRRVVPRDL